MFSKIWTKKYTESYSNNIKKLRKVLDNLVYQGKIDPEICTKAMQEYMNDKKMKRTFARKNIVLKKQL